MKTKTIITIGKGVVCENVPAPFLRKVKKDLSFDNPEYVNAVKYGKFISADTPSHLHLFEIEDDNCWLPRGYVYWLLKWMNSHKQPYTIRDKTLLLAPLNLKFKGKLKPLQKPIIPDLMGYPCGVLEAEAGCLTGDTVVRLNRARKGCSCSLDHLFKKFNGGGGSIGPDWDTTIPTYIRSYNHDENQILLNEVIQVYYSGEKEVYKFTLESGKIIKSTLDHRVLTSNGWKSFKDINKNELIMVDTPNGAKTNTKKAKEIYYKELMVKYHPYAAVRQATKIHKKYYSRPTHCLVYEAELNNMSLSKFLDILRNNKSIAETLKFVDSSKYSIHHKDENRHNNFPENLEKLLKRKHGSLHGKKAKRHFGQGIPKWEKIIKKERIGLKNTYDISCRDPYNNFTANDIVVHNSGKTVVGIYMIVQRRQPTLIIVHSKELLYQWEARIMQFTGEEVGLVGDGKFKLRPITVGIINSIKNNIDELEPHFGHLICDEAHRITSESWAGAMQKFRARYWLGLTATPFRPDGLGNAIFASIGPLRHTVDRKKLQDEGDVLKPNISRIHTSFNYMFLNDYSTMITEMTKDVHRNTLITNKIAQDLSKNNENILIVSDRQKHLKIMQKLLFKNHGIKSHVLSGKVGTKQRKKIIQRVKDGLCKILFATTSLIGEGFDAPELAAMFMGTPIKFSGRLIQTVGRILRPKEDKFPRLFDFRDNKVPVLQYSGFNRDRVYKKKGW